MICDKNGYSGIKSNTLFTIIIINFAQITANLQVTIALDLFDFNMKTGYWRNDNFAKAKMHPFHLD